MRLAALLALAVLPACDSHPYDAAEKPAVRVTADARGPVVSWTPSGAMLLRVYAGAVAGDGYGPALVWSVASADGANGIAGPVVYGTLPAGAAVDVAARPLVAGQAYTAEVTRRDPNGSGDGFTNTRRRYVGTATFTAP